MSDDQQRRPPEDQQPIPSDDSAHESTPGASLTDQRLGDFELLRELGRGGMGIVYEARQVSLKRRVALKVLPPGLGLTAHAVKRFEREAQAAAKLHHTNIVPVYTTGQDRGCHFYAMEMVDGQSLSQVLADLRGERSNALMEETMTQVVGGDPEPRIKDRNNAAVPSSLSETDTARRRWFDTVATLLAEVGHALQHAHDNGVIHRDVKPANLLLSGDGRLSVGDFGLARLTQEPGMTVSGSFLGTPAYMSPEQIAAGRVKLDHRTDIYSLGAVLYEMLTLRRPFSGDSREQVLSAILSKDPKPPRSINPRVPLDLDTICLKAMEKDPDRRYPTAGEMAEDLEQYLRGELIAARRAGPLRRASKAVRRHPVAAVSSVALVVIVTLASWAMWLSGRQSEEVALRAVSDARFFMSQGDYQEGLETIDAALAASPRLSEAHLMRARLLIQLNRSREAVEEANAILADDPDDWRGHLILGLAARAPEHADRLMELSAEEHLQAVERAAPETADTYYLRALLEENDRTAIELLNRSLALDPAGADAMLERCRRHVDVKNFRAALLDGERLIGVRPRSAQGRRMIGEIYSAIHDADRALDELTQAIRLDPEDPVTYMSRATILRDLERGEEALADLTKAIELDPDYSRFYEQRARVHLLLRRLDEAIRDAERAIELNDEFAAGYAALAAAYAESGQRENSDAVVEEFLAKSADWRDKETVLGGLGELATILGMRGSVKEALEILDRADRLLPDAPNVYGWRAWIAQATGDVDGFEAACDRLESLEPQELDRWIDIGESLRLVCDRPDAAITALSAAIALAPEWADPFAWRAWMYHLSNRLEESLADYARSLDLAPRWADVYRWRAEVYMDMERFEDALGDLNRAVALGTEAWGVRAVRAAALARMGREKEAFEDLDLDIQRFPDAGRAYVQRGHMHVRLGDLEAALADVERGIRADPNSEAAYFGRAELTLLQSGSCDRAEQDRIKAVELASHTGLIDTGLESARLHAKYLARVCPELHDPEFTLSHAAYSASGFPLGWQNQQAFGMALYRNGQLPEARATLRRSLDLQHRPSPDTLFFLAMVHWKLGDRAEARAAFDQGQSRLDATWPKHLGILFTRREAADTLGLEP
ncbi:MAG: protein kinase domain-containing protein [Planctomycetota bacterium]|jgi:serine/threonine protein kinase/regulator of sirC expression with transglutaminase-like and TPR domain